jgi:heme-degrading monooxygenase HmoA
MIARIWRGATAVNDAEAYVDYLRQTGLADYERTPGNMGAWALWRQTDGLVEFLAVSLWDSEGAIAAFAGDDIERAVFYAEDDRFLVERDETVRHFQVATGPTISPSVT